MDRGQADIVVSELGTQLGLSPLALNESGSCTLVVDDGAVIVTIGYNQRTGSIDLMTCLDAVELSPARLARAMKANFCWLGADGAMFALEPNSGAFVLQQRCPDEDVAHGGLVKRLESLVLQTQAWTKLLSSNRAHDVSSAAGAAASATPSGGGLRA